jgi:hypothetical protein
MPQPLPHPSRRTALVLLAALGLTAVAVYVGVEATAPGQSKDSRPLGRSSPTPLSNVDLSGLPIARTSPCGRIDQDDAAAALGGPVSVAERYRPGDRVDLGRGLRDVSDEFGCTYRTGVGAEARVWLFAQPVDHSVASGIVREARAQKGCRPVGDGPAFGSPTATTTCATVHPRGRSVTLRGLFGDAWLSCQLTLPVGGSGGVADAETRAQRWCLAVATAAGSGS